MTSSGSSLDLVQVPGIPITRYADAVQVLRSKQFVTHRPESHPMIGGSLVLIDGEEHFKRRRMESGLFTTSAIRYYEAHALKPIIDEALDKVWADADGDGVAHVDLLSLVLDMLYRLSASIIGIDGVDRKEDVEHFKSLFVKMADGATVDWSTRDHDEVLNEARHAREQFIESFYAKSFERRAKAVREHLTGALPAEQLPKDLLTSLILADPDTDGDSVDALPLREVVLYLLASIRTTLHSLPHAVAHLTDWTSVHPEDGSRLSDQVFLREAMIEAVRLHAPLPAVKRMALESMETLSGVKIQAGDEVSILLDLANRDPEIFGDNAEKFDPYREVKPQRLDLPGSVAPWGVAFGVGAHVCIGRRLVMGDTEGTRDDDTRVHGVSTSILDALYGFDMTVDESRPPELEKGSLYDAYSTFPIVLRRRSQQ